MNQQEKKSPKLLLIDGNGLVYRAFYALPARKVSLGFPVNAIWGFISLLLNAISSEKPTHVAVAFDHGAFVDTLTKFQSFNVQREEMLDDLEMQLPLVEDFVQVCGLKSFRLPGFEADDCIGTIASKASREGFETLIISGDLGLMQLVSPHIKVMTMRRGIVDSVIYDEDLVLKKYGLRPSQLADLRALAGDSSQNIGGVPGIGEVTARRLLSQYNSLSDLFDSLDQLPAKWRNPLSENRDDAFEYLARSTIRCDLPLEIDWDECRFHGFPVQMVQRIFEQVQCDGAEPFIKGMARQSGPERDCHIPSAPLYGEEARQALCGCVEAKGPISLVWLIDQKSRQPWGLSLCLAGQKPFYLDLAAWYGEEAEGGETLTRQEIIDYLNPIFLDPQRVKYVSGIERIFEAGLPLVQVYDISLVSSLLDLAVWDHAIEAVCARYGFAIYDRLLLFGLDPKSLGEVPLANRICWTARAADVLLGLGDLLRAKLIEGDLQKLYLEVEVPLAAASWRCNNAGWSCDRELAGKIVELVDQKLAALHEQFFAEAGVEPFDLSSEEALSDYLFNHLALLVPTRPKNGSILNTETLKSLQEQNPIVAKIQAYCELHEFKETFVRQFMLEGQLDIAVGEHLFNLALVGERRLQILGRVSTKGATELMVHMIAVAANLACAEVRRPLTKAIDGFLRPQGVSRLIYLSFPAMALRMLAHLAHDERLTNDLRSGQDVELSLLRELFGEKLEEVVSARQLFVQLIFFYFSPAWLARRLNLAGEEGLAKAQEYLAKFERILSERYPASWDYLLSCQAKASAMEELVTQAGRRCRFVQAGSRNYSVRENAEREARAFGVEGSCADLFRQAIVLFYEAYGSEIAVMPCNNMLIMIAPAGREVEVAERCRQICLQLAEPLELAAEYRIR